MNVKKCRICSSRLPAPFLSLGSMPAPNRFPAKEELKNNEPGYPLSVSVCSDCWLVQLQKVVPPQIMFKNYVYIPSTSTTMQAHFKKMSRTVTKKFNLKKQDLVLDIGSNDGTLLTFFKEQGLRVLGVDPASNLSLVARLKGIDTIEGFFNSNLAEKITKQFGHPKIITATNVLAHVSGLHDFVEGIKILIKKNGCFIAQFPYLVDLLEKTQFDTIYHEHLSYFSLKPLIRLLDSHNLKIFDAQKEEVHGGSLTVYISNKNSPYSVGPGVKELVRREDLKKLGEIKTYDDFARRAKKIKSDLVNFLVKLKKNGKRIAGYGAAAKGNVLLSFCHLDNKTIDYIVDSISFKQGRFTPGTHIPIYPESFLEKDMPDYTLLLAWNFAGEILKKQINYISKGGKFIFAHPNLIIT